MTEESGGATARDTNQHDAHHSADDAPAAELSLPFLAGRRDVDWAANTDRALLFVGLRHAGDRRKSSSHPHRARVHRHHILQILRRYQRALQIYILVIGAP